MVTLTHRFRITPSTSINLLGTGLFITLTLRHHAWSGTAESAEERKEVNSAEMIMKDPQSKGKAKVYALSSNRFGSIWASISDT